MQDITQQPKQIVRRKKMLVHEILFFASIDLCLNELNKMTECYIVILNRIIPSNLVLELGNALRDMRINANLNMKSILSEILKTGDAYKCVRLNL